MGKIRIPEGRASPEGRDAIDPAGIAILPAPIRLFMSAPRGISSLATGREFPEKPEKHARYDCDTVVRVLGAATTLGASQHVQSGITARYP